MSNILLIFIFLIVFLVLIFLLFFYLKRNKRSNQEKSLIPTHNLFSKDQEFNPDISTDNWDLHKLRLEKFRRSQYKGLTFFICSENRIYYLSEDGNKVYC